MVLMFRVIVTSSTTNLSSRGATSSSQIACISAGGPGIDTMMPPSRSVHQPGAVPFRLVMNWAEGINWACFMLREGMSVPRSRNCCSRCRTASSWTVGVSPRAAATPSLVKSS